MSKEYRFKLGDAFHSATLTVTNGEFVLKVEGESLSQFKNGGEAVLFLRKRWATAKRQAHIVTDLPRTIETVDDELRLLAFCDMEYFYTGSPDRGFSDSQKFRIDLTAVWEGVLPQWEVVPAWCFQIVDGMYFRHAPSRDYVAKLVEDLKAGGNHVSEHLGTSIIVDYQSVKALPVVGFNRIDEEDSQKKFNPKAIAWIALVEPTMWDNTILVPTDFDEACKIPELISQHQKDAVEKDIVRFFGETPDYDVVRLSGYEYKSSVLGVLQDVLPSNVGVILEVRDFALLARISDPKRLRVPNSLKALVIGKHGSRIRQIRAQFNLPNLQVA